MRLVSQCVVNALKFACSVCPVQSADRQASKDASVFKDVFSVMSLKAFI